MTYFEFTKRFPDENSAIDFIVAAKYKDGYVCPKCGCTHKGIYHQKYNRRFLYCNNCKSEFSALTGTIFENTHLDLRMWLYAMNLVIVSRKGISALQLSVNWVWVHINLLGVCFIKFVRQWKKRSTRKHLRPL